MSNFLRDRFPLADTSTAYISGKAVYNLVRYDTPGIIASVVLFPADAEAFRAEVCKAMAEVWDEAFTRGFHSGQSLPSGADASESPVENPYEKGDDRG